MVVRGLGGGGKLKVALSVSHWGGYTDPHMRKTCLELSRANGTPYTCTHVCTNARVAKLVRLGQS